MKYVPCALGLAVMLVFAAPCFGASQGPYSPGTVTSEYDPYGQKDNIKLSDTLYFMTDSSQYGFLQVNLFVDGETPPEATHNIGEPYTAEETYVSMGGADDKWGISLTPAQVNDSGFGVEMLVDYYGTCTATNFGFNVPASATIDGVLVETQGKLFYNDGPGYDCIEINHIRMTVYYTEATPPVTRLRNSNWRNATIR